MRNWWKKTGLLLLAGVVILAGCRKEKRPADEANETSAQWEFPGPWPPPFTFAAPPPLAPGPELSPDKAPTRYACARVGMKAVYRVTPERGKPSRQILEIVRTDSRTIHARQTAETEFGRFVQTLTYNRFTDKGIPPDKAKPQYVEKPIGTKVVKVGKKRLRCTVYEAVRDGRYRYQTLRCDDIPSLVVQHIDNVVGPMKVRLQLLDIQD